MGRAERVIRDLEPLGLAPAPHRRGEIKARLGHIKTVRASTTIEHVSEGTLAGRDLLLFVG